MSELRILNHALTEENKRNDDLRENAIGCLMLAQLSLREGNALAGLIHVNHALDALRHEPKK